jgi:signal peptidase I
MAKQTNTERPDWRRQAREIADSLAIAFILAMVIRHFVLEVFKIPTKSMQPTLLGDPWTGDKILVNKLAYDFDDPDRWDVIVFKFPDNVAKNYIKRVVGLPGERVWVRDGDLYVNGQIARKPWPVQDAMWRRCSNSGRVRAKVRGLMRDVWIADAPEYWTLEDHLFEVDARHSPYAQMLEYNLDIMAYEERHLLESRSHVPPSTTSDVMARFVLEPRALVGDARVRFIVEAVQGITNEVDQWQVLLPLAGGECLPELMRWGDLVKKGAAYRLEAGRGTLVEVCNVDRTIIVSVGGREVLRHEYDPPESKRHVYERRGFSRRAEVLLGTKGGHVRFRDPGLYVDVFYTNYPFRRAVEEPYLVKPDEFFVLGDNSANSNDSRGWEQSGGVPRSYLVGEAFLVLWPLGRMKIVR